MMLPDELEWVLEMLGYNWPTADEDKLRDSAALWRKFGDDVTALHEAANASARQVTSHGTKETAYRVFITPQFGDWRLLYGNAFLDAFGGDYLTEKASRQCGEAHFYSIDTYHDVHAWCVARNSHVVRRHATWGDPEWEGDPLPFELDYLEGRIWIDPSQISAQGVTDANVAGRHLSVDVGFMLESETQGHGWLATTHPDVPSSRFKGALPI
jgi:hypothetical protein